MNTATPRALVVIPARYGSTRLPAKALALIGGIPMVVRVLQQARRMTTASRVIVATDHHRIADAVQAAGGEAMMTSPDHPSGTDRVAEVTRKIPCEYVVNIQGDEPFIDPLAVDAAVEALHASPSCNMSTICVEVGIEEARDPAVTKVTRDLNGYALYFSKALIPHDRDGAPPGAIIEKHLGVYVFRRDFLLQYAAWEPTPLERREKLEQLRALERGERILVVTAARDSLGIDTQHDLDRANALAVKD